MIIGYDPAAGRWYEYTPTGRTPIHCQRLARIVRPAVTTTAPPDTAGSTLAISFMATFSTVLAVLILIKELLA